MTITLRHDQADLKNRIYESWNAGIRNALAVLPTGGGKSIIVSDIVLDGVHAGLSQAVIAHRNELVLQMSMHLARRGIPHRIIGSTNTVAMIQRAHRADFGKSFVNPSARTAVVGVDTLVSRAVKLAEWAAQIDRWIIDEAHHVLRENKWGKAVAMFPRAQGLGVTATPKRADGKGLGREYDGVFDVMHIGPDMRYLINIGALADFEIVCPTSDLEVPEDSVSANGDWSTQTLKKAAKQSRIVGDVLRGYMSFAFGRQCIVFATDVESANDMARRFNETGIPAASLSAETNFIVREKYIKEFKSGKCRVLVNVDLFDEGFDVPACDVVSMARPTASLGKYRQMVGRALRPMPGKVALIIDHVSNIVRHGLPDKVTEWSLARADKRGKQEKDPDDIPQRNCLNPVCFKPYEKFRTCCPYCGMVPPLPEPQKRTVEMVEGDLILLDRAKLEEMRRATQVESPGDIAARVAAAAGDFAGRGVANRQIEKITAQSRLKESIAQWAAVERVKGLNDSEIQRKFYLTTGTDVLSAMDGSRSRQDFDNMAQRIEGWYL